MSNQNKLENKNIRKSERLHAVPTLHPHERSHPLGTVARKMRETSIDRVARRIVRARRAIRRGEAVLATLAPGSKFRPPVEAALRFERAAAVVARAELARRAEKKCNAAAVAA